MYLDYYRLVQKAAASGLFDVAAHLDLPKKFGDLPVDAEVVAEAADAALRAVRAAGMAIEINTSGWRRPASEAYPAPDLLARAAELGIPLTFGSDAHRPSEVACDFARAVELARAAGYTQTLCLGDRTLVDLS